MIKNLGDRSLKIFGKDIREQKRSERTFAGLKLIIILSF